MECRFYLFKSGRDTEVIYNDYTLGNQDEDYHDKAIFDLDSDFEVVEQIKDIKQDLFERGIIDGFDLKDSKIVQAIMTTYEVRTSVMSKTGNGNTDIKTFEALKHAKDNYEYFISRHDLKEEWSKPFRNTIVTISYGICNYFYTEDGCESEDYQEEDSICFDFN